MRDINTAASDLADADDARLALIALRDPDMIRDVARSLRSALEGETATPFDGQECYCGGFGGGHQTGCPETAPEPLITPTEQDRSEGVVYEQWSDRPGYVPWVTRGNSFKQDDARRLVSRRLAALRQPGEAG